MGKRSWYNDLARDTRDLAYLQRVYGPKTEEERKRRQGCGKAFGIALGLIIGLIIAFFIWVDHDVQKNAPANTATAIAKVNSVVESPQVLASVLDTPEAATSTDLTEVVIPTINPQLLIRYEQDGQCMIKGNINSKGAKIYHLPGSSAYASTKIDTKTGERWFCTEYDAIQAGWHAPGQ